MKIKASCYTAKNDIYGNPYFFVVFYFQDGRTFVSHSQYGRISEYETGMIKYAVEELCKKYKRIKANVKITRITEGMPIREFNRLHKYLLKLSESGNNNVQIKKENP